MSDLDFSSQAVAPKELPDFSSQAKQSYSQLGSAAIGAAESLTPTMAGLAAAGRTAIAVAPTAATLGPVAGTILEVGAPILVGAGVGIATSMGQRTLLPENVVKEIAKAEADNPKTFFAAGLLDQLPFFGVGAATKATRAVLGGLGGLTEAGSELSQGKPLDPTKIGLSTIAGGSLTKPTKAGNWLTQGAFSGHTTPLQSKDLPQEDSRLAETINKWGKMNESDTQLTPTSREVVVHPKELIQTAIKDKATGAIEPMGPKHDEVRKAETVDTHDQGFLTKDGTFLNRKEAAGWARETGQIPQDHQLERPSEGLHSGDLRTAGDKRFEFTPDYYVSQRQKELNQLTKEDPQVKTTKSILDPKGNLPQISSIPQEVSQSIEDSLKWKTGTKHSEHIRSLIDDLEHQIRSAEAAGEPQYVNQELYDGLNDLKSQETQGSKISFTWLSDSVKVEKADGIYTISHLGKDSSVDRVSFDSFNEVFSHAFNLSDSIREDLSDLYGKHFSKLRSDTKFSKRGGDLVKDLRQNLTTPLQPHQFSNTTIAKDTIVSLLGKDHPVSRLVSFIVETSPPAKIKTAKGWVTDTAQSKTFGEYDPQTHEIIIRESGGNTPITIAHEIVHSGTVRKMYAAYMQFLSGKEVSPAWHNLNKVAQDVTDDLILYSKERSWSKEDHPKLNKLLSKIEYAQTNSFEVLAELVNPEVVLALSKIKAREQTKTLGTKLKESIVSFLGLKGKDRTALDSLLDAMEVASKSSIMSKEKFFSYGFRKRPNEYFSRGEVAPIPSPESINTKTEFDEAGRKVLQDHGPEAARKFAKDVANHRRIKENETIPQVLERNRVWNESVANASTPLEKAAIINGDIVLEQIDHTNTMYGAQEAIGQALNDIRAAIRDSDIARHDIEKAVPNKDIRDRMTRAAEAERWYDKLLSDDEKELALYGDKETLEDYLKRVEEDKLAGRETQPSKLGMRGILNLWSKRILEAESGTYENKPKFDNPIQEKIWEKQKLAHDKFWAKKEQDPEFAKLATKEEKIALLKEKSKRLQYSFDKLKAFPSEEHAIPVLKAIQERLAKLGTQAKELGLMKGWINNYIPHVLDFSKTNMTKAQQQDFLKKILGGVKGSKLERDFTQQRHYDTLRELEKAVEGTGVVVHTDIARIIQAYEKSMQTSFIQKKLLDKLSTTIDSSGRPMVVDITKISGEEAAKLLKDKYVPFQGKGSKFLENTLVSPEIEAAMGHMATQKDPSFALRTMGAITHLTKVVNTVGSLFHAKSLAEVNLLIDPISALKEVFTAGAGTRAAVRELQTNRNNTIINDFIKSGLIVEMPEDIQRTIVADLGKTIDRGLGHTGFGPNLRAIQRATDPFDQHILQNLNKFTWDYMHSGSKVRVAMDLFAKAKAKNPDIPDAVHMKEISNFVNNAFGGVNWLQEANKIQGQFLRGLAQGAAGIRGREYGQILMFAPDWTYSTIKSMVNALPKELMKPKNWELRAGLKGIYNPTKTGDYARRYALATAITYATILNGINMAMSGHSMLENKDPTRIDLGDGTSMQGAKHSLEVLHLIRDPDAYLGNKLGFIPKSVAIITTGTAYPSPRAPKLRDTSMVGRVKAVALGASPFQVSSGAQAPEGEGLKRAAASTLGFPIYGRQTSASMEAEIKQTKAKERAQKRMERAKEKRERSYSHQ